MKIVAEEIKTGGGLEIGGTYIGIVTASNPQISEKKNQKLISFTINISGKKYRTKLYQIEGKGRIFLDKALNAMGIKEFDDENNSTVLGYKAEFKYDNEKGKDGKEYGPFLLPIRPLGKATESELLDLEGAAF